MACDPEDTITSEKLEKANCQLGVIDDVVEKTDETTETCSGATIYTLRGQLARLGWIPPIPYAAAISFTVNDGAKTVERSTAPTGWYAPRQSELPFTTSGTWTADDENKFHKLNANDLSQISGSMNGNSITNMNAYIDAQTSLTYADLDAIPSALVEDGFESYVTKEGIAGSWVATTGVHTANGGTIRTFGDNPGRYWYRRYDGDIFPSWFIDGAADSYPGAQAAVDFALSNTLSSQNSTQYVDFESAEYQMSRPLVIARASKIKSSGAMLIRTTNTTSGLPIRLARAGTVNDVMNVDAVLIIDHPDNSYSFHVDIIGELDLRGNVTTAYGVYAPRMALSNLDRLESTDCVQGFYTHDTWMTTLDFKSVRGQKGIVWADDGTGGSTGTSIFFKNCWPQQCTVIGWDLFGLQYAAATACGCDNMPSGTHVIKTQNTNIVFNGLGCEGNTTEKWIQQTSGEVTINNAVIFTLNISDRLIRLSDGATMDIQNIRSANITGIGSGNRAQLDTNSALRGDKKFSSIVGTDSVVDTASYLVHDINAAINIRKSTHNLRLGHQVQDQAWVKFAGASGTKTAGEGLTVVRTAAGRYSLTFDETRSNVNYGAQVTVEYTAGGMVSATESYAVTGFNIRLRNLAGVDTDATSVTVSVKGGF